MEKILKTALVITLSLGLVAGTQANDTDGNDGKNKKAEKASTNLQYEVKSIPDTKKIVMGVKLEEPGNIQVKIFDSQGKRVYAEKQEDSQGFVRIYDMTALDSERYTVQFTSDNNIQEANVDFRRANANAAKFVAYFPSTFDKNVQVSYANAQSTVNLAVERVNGEQIFDMNLDSKAQDSFIANLSALSKGVYQVRVTSEGESYTKQVTIK